MTSLFTTLKLPKPISTAQLIQIKENGQDKLLIFGSWEDNNIYSYSLNPTIN